MAEGKKIPPEYQDVVNHFKDKTQDKPVTEAKKFFAHYEAIGWMMGRNKIKNWKMAANSWLLKKEDYSGRTQQAPVSSTQREDAEKYRGIFHFIDNYDMVNYKDEIIEITGITKAMLGEIERLAEEVLEEIRYPVTPEFKKYTIQCLFMQVFKLQ